MKLLFVYNADSGLWDSLLDIGHKAVSPDTYGCNLCSITHGALRERPEWKKFKRETRHELEFLHRDEFEKRFGKNHGYGLPAVFAENGEGNWKTLIPSAELESLKGVADLVERLPPG